MMTSSSEYRSGDLLTEAGHEVKCVSDGRGVIEELQGNSDGFALLLLDLQMPYIDGYEVLEWMRDNSLAGRFPRTGRNRGL